ncbi:MAG TPA: DUF1700 domain-containing protein [Candidatus Dorea intestinavium]|nr:DUF1700 domain-containing protein [Candidatus Dorea intestinavium]
MSRIEFMKELATLLDDIPLEEKQDAIVYYEDYFDEAGVLKEQEVIKELGSPQAVALIIKQNLETKEQSPESERAQSLMTKPPLTKRTDNNKIMKIILVVLIIIVGAPIIIPIAVGIIGLLIGLVATMFGVFLALVIVAISVVATGIALGIVGMLSLIPDTAAAAVLIGVGLIITGIGLLVTYGSIKLCLIVFPSMVRFLVNLIKKPFQRKSSGVMSSEK